MEVRSLPYIDIQHDALAVFDDVEQGIVQREDIWISAYQAGSSSVHGKARVTVKEGGGSEFVTRDGVQLERISKTNFTASFQTLHLDKISIRFPRQVIHPPYQKKTSTSAPLHVNAIAHSPTLSQMAIAGPDGFLVVVPCGPEGDMGDKVEMKGHVGDVFDVKWFPSGEVLLSSSSDLSIRVWGVKDGINPRTLKGHTRAVTSLGIVGVGKQIVSGSLDGTIRIWEVGTAKEIRKMETDQRGGILQMVLVDSPTSLSALGASEEERVVLLATQNGLEVFRWSNGDRIQSIKSDVGSNIVSMDYSAELGLIVTGHANGVIALRRLDNMEKAWLFRRNEASVYSVKFSETDLLVGTASGLPCRLRVMVEEDDLRLELKEEYAGWEAVGVETWAISKDGVWCAGGEGGVRRY